MTIRKERRHENVTSNRARSSSFDDQRRDRSAHFETAVAGGGGTEKWCGAAACPPKQMQLGTHRGS